MAIDYSTLNMGEIALIESLSNAPFAVLAEEDKPKGLALAALAFVIKKRENSEFTWNDAQALTLAEVTALIGSDEDAEPANPLEDDDAGKAPKTSA